MSEKAIFGRVAAIGLTVIALLVLRPAMIGKPVIGIPNTKTTKYAEAITKAGGIPVLLPYDRSEIPKHLSKLDGVLFPGGADLPPSMYGDKEVHPTVKLVTEERLSFEYEFAKAWLKETDKPYLGVCLGCQLLNVVQGGSLVQDIPSEFGGNHRVDHAISIEPDSKLHGIFETENLMVNSRHHQAVRDVGEGLKVAAAAPDGIVEAIEMMSDRFVVGVQWHPESMKTDVHQQKLFSRFIKEAARRKLSARP